MPPKRKAWDELVELFIFILQESDSSEISKEMARRGLRKLARDLMAKEAISLN